MDMNVNLGEKIICPSIIFKVKDHFYSVNSANIAGIMQLPEYQKVPEAPPHVKGIFVLRGETVSMSDMRIIFGYKTLNDEFEEFKEMIEHRKNDHLRWAEELERCAETGEEFTLASNPHDCAFGKWYYSYKSENNVIKTHLRAIDQPHTELHEAAVKLKKYQQTGETKEIEKLINAVKEDYVPTVLKLLDETVEAFRTEVFHEMLLVFQGNGDRQLGIVVDEVVAVEDLQRISDRSAIARFQTLGLVSGICKSSRIDDIVLELDEEKLKSVCL